MQKHAIKKDRKQVYPVNKVNNQYELNRMILDEPD